MGANNNNWTRGKRRAPRDNRDDASATPSKRSNRGGVAAAQRKSRAELHSPKRKYAIVFGYNGIGHHGMQRQIPGSPTGHLPTIEGVMEKALIASGALTEEQIEEYFKIQWSRVGRTDAGVHATCQVVTAKISLGPLSVQAIENQHEEHKKEEKGAAAAAASAAGSKDEGTDVDMKDAEKRSEVVKPSSAADQPSANQSEDPAFKQVITSQGPGIVDVPEEEGADFSHIQRERELEFLKKLEANMPEGFEIFEVTRVANNFDARHNCSERLYEYYIPLKYFEEVQLHENEEIIRDFFRKYGSGKIELVDKVEDQTCSVTPNRICLLTHEEKKELLTVVKNRTSLKTAWDLKTDSHLADLCTRYRRELSWIRRLFSSLNKEERRKCWLDLHGSDPLIYEHDCIPYAPPPLLSLRPINYSPPTQGSTAPHLAEGEAMKEWKPDNEEAFIKRVNEILGRYEGHHNWFNYTSRMKSTDPAACRFMKSVTAHMATENTKIPMVVVRLLGSSFVLSQIRKMITVMLETMIGTAPLAANVYLFEKPLEPKKHVHLAPGEMLMLERAIFETENRTTKEPITNLTFSDPYEQKYPHGSKMRELLEEGKYHQIKKPLPANPLSNPLTGADAENDEEGAEKSLEDQSEELSYEWHEANRKKDSADFNKFADVPVWFRIIKFKFEKLIPEAWRKCQKSHVFDQYMNDLLWHPFFVENYPEPTPTDYFKDIDDQIKKNEAELKSEAEPAATAEE